MYRWNTIQVGPTASWHTCAVRFKKASGGVELDLAVAYESGVRAACSDLLRWAETSGWKEPGDSRHVLRVWVGDLESHLRMLQGKLLKRPPREGGTERDIRVDERKKLHRLLLSDAKELRAAVYSLVDGNESKLPTMTTKQAVESTTAIVDFITGLVAAAFERRVREQE